MQELEQIDKITSIISHFAIIITALALVIQIKQNRLTNAIIFKDRFIASTARYVKIQELLLTKNELANLNAAIYKGKLSSVAKNQEANFIMELPVCAIMFQTMEDVWLMHDLKDGGGKHRDLFSGWEGLFKDWMATDEVKEKWRILNHHFGREFVAYVETNYLKQTENSIKDK